MKPYFVDEHLTVFQGDARAVLAELPAESVHCVVTSPPYWALRDYGTAGQLGLESTPEEYVTNLVAVFREVRRVLRKDGTVWLVLGDSYAVSGNGGGGLQATNVGSLGGAKRRRGRGLLKPKDRVMIPARVALALQADGWWIRDEIVWSKPNPMPSSVRDRTTPAHEMVYLLTKSARYHYDAAAIRERTTTRPELLTFGNERPGRNGTGRIPDRRRMKGRTAATYREATATGLAPKTERQRVGLNNRWDESRANGTAPAGRNKRSVWTVAPEPYTGAHFATFPEKLIEPCIKAGCPEGGVTLDPFAGSGTTGLVAQRLGRRAILIDLSMDYLGQLMARNAQVPLGLLG